MKNFLALCFLILGLCSVEMVAATDIVTLSGKKYFDVHDVQVRGNLLTFTTDTEVVKLPLSDVPDAIKERYTPKATPTPTPEPVAPESLAPATLPAQNPETATKPGTPTSAHDLVVNTGNKYLAQMAADLQTAQTSPPVTYTATDAFSVAKLDDAIKDALANGRAIGFFLVDDALLTGPCTASEANAKGALAHFVQTFGRSVTPVFVFPQRDLAKLPGTVTIALGKPVPVPVPRVIFTNSDVSETLADLSLPSDKSTYAQRNELIYPAAGMIKRWYVKIANSVP